MKKKLFGKILSVLLAAAMLASLGAVTAFAETEVKGGTMSFDKYLVMDGNANTPTATFEFTIAAGTAVAADLTNNKPPVFAGVGTPTIAAGQAAFSPTDTASTTVATGDVITIDGTAYAGGTLPDSKKYASKSVTVSFADVTFTKPGIYRYVITETAAAAALADIITNDTSNTRVLDVYVESDGAALSVKDYILHRGTDIQVNAGGEYGNDKKDTGFTNKYLTTDLTLKKTVSGNQAYRQQYFKFDVVINGAAGAKYTVNLTDATTAAVSLNNNTYTNSALLTADDTGKVEATYCLKHDQQIVIQGLPKGATYSIVEDLSNDEGYTVTAKKDSADLRLTNTKGTDTQTMDGTDDIIVYNNYRNGTVPTGILLDVAPYALMVVLAGAAILILAAKKRRSSESRGL